ncbi:MAG: cytochrome c3 family protein, partial [Anaerolineae bacterium]
MFGKKRRLSPLFWSIVLCAAVLLVFAWAGSVWGDPGPHGSRQCVNCHDPHAGPNGFFPACDTCHNGATAPAVSTHANRDFSGTAEAPFDLACTQCHDPHGSSNLWLIREAVRINPTLGITGPVVFTATTGLNSFDDGISLPATRLCLTCHNTPGNPGYPTQNHPGGANHMGGASYTGLDCTTCHPHDVDDDPATLDGFMPAGGCTGCHAMPQDNGDGLPPGGRRPVVDEFGATSHHVQGTVQDDDCLACHSMANHQQGTVQLKDPDLGQSLIYTVDPANLAGLENFCLNCHDAGGAAANGGAPPFSDGRTPPDVNGIVGETWADSAHRGAGQTCADCHGGNGHGSDNIKLLPQPGVDALCYTCHTDGMVQNDALANNRPGGYVSADDIEEAFGKGVTHTLGATFTIGSDTFTLQCTTCHNPHLASGRYWDAENGLTPVSRPDFSDPANNPRAMGVTLWGNNPGEKMDDFAAQGSGSGGWYYSVARGGAIVFDQPAVYQPPKQGNDWNFEFGGQVLPDYTTLCLDCHSYRMSDANPPVNWGQ